jgi:UDP:flavonoid glycosyltransferase YjiC (YdhE family)
MKAYLMTIGSLGDVLPMTALGSALQRQGARVKLFAMGYFRAEVERAGLEFVSLDGTESPPPPPSLDNLTRLMFYRIEEVYQLLRETIEADSSPVLLVGTTLSFPIRFLGERTGWPTVAVHMSPNAFRSYLQPRQCGALRIPEWLPAGAVRVFWWLIDRLFADRRICPPVNRARQEIGLPPIRRIFHNWIHDADISLGLFPEWFSGHPPDWPRQTLLGGFPMQDGPGELPPEVEEFLAAGPPPAVLTVRSQMVDRQRLYRIGAAACEKLGHRCLLVIPSREWVESTAPGLMCVEAAPFGKLFSRASLLIHPGSIGTTALALAAGLPQLCLPTAFDQYDNARRVCELGAGLSLRASRCTTERVVEKLQTLANPVFAARAREIATMMEPAEPNLDRVALEMLRMAERKLALQGSNKAFP